MQEDMTTVSDKNNKLLFIKLKKKEHFNKAIK